MTDDIVTRLRIENYPLLKFGNHQDWCTALGIMDEAADEIERLRKELADWKKVAEYEHAGFCGCCGQDESHLLNTLEVYVRNNE
jgi:hypothetical protein